MSKTKILYIAHGSGIAGAEVCLLTLIKHLNKELFEPVVVFPFEGPMVKRTEELGIRTYLNPLEPWEWWITEPSCFGRKGNNFTERVQAIAQIIETERPDIVHTNTAVVWEGAIAAKLKNIPHVWHLHEILGEHSHLKPILPFPLVYWIIDALSEKIAVVSNAARIRLLDYMDDDKLVTIHNGIETRDFQHNGRPTIREELTLPDDAILAVTIGSLGREKGYKDLLEAASIVRKKGGEVYFLIVGDGSAEAAQELKRKIEDLGLEDCVYYLGFRHDVPQILRGSDFLVLPSHTEAFPLVILEAIAARKPVVATDCGGPAEMIVNGESGFIVPVRAPESLGEKILEMAQDKERMKEMGENAHQRFNECGYRAEDYASRFEKLYKEMAATRIIVCPSDKDRLLAVSLMNVYQVVYEKHEQYEEQRQEIGGLHREKEELREELHQEIGRLNQGIEDLRSSLSWRVTKPLRWARRATLRRSIS